ncbi:MAG: COX15/CtaA family protein [Novosphingobium sp.]|nr:COX15/CtaA family protein [Novosphingobium sp.]
MVAFTERRAVATATGEARPLALARWLLFVAALVVAIVVVGGITRLTESGVSITEWKPVSGALPPFTHAQWQAEFDAYRHTPQFIEVNGPAGMILATYKFIFLWEWVHRLLARAIGVVLVGVVAWFGFRREIPRGYLPRLLALVGLIGLQGAIGWWMVESGIQSNVKVSHLRLATHLFTALVTLSALVRVALDLRGLARDEPAARLTGFGAFALAIVAVQVVLGAMVAGLRAGHVANDWPLMMGRLFPAGVGWSRGAEHALLYDPFLLHFLHRWWAWVVVAVLVVMGRRLRRIGARPASVAVHSAFGTQVLLGIATVLTNVTLWIAVLHQLVGALVVATTVWGAHALGRRA